MPRTLCWFCRKEVDGLVGFSCQFDSYVHVDCCRKNLPEDREDYFNHTGRQAEALIIWPEIRPLGEL